MFRGFVSWNKPSSIQTIMEMEFYEMNGEFLEVLKAIRTKRNVASVVLLSLVCINISYITLDFETFVRSTHRLQKSKVSKKMIGFYGSTRLLSKG